MTFQVDLRGTKHAVVLIVLFYSNTIKLKYFFITSQVIIYYFAFSDQKIFENFIVA